MLSRTDKAIAYNTNLCYNNIMKHRLEKFGAATALTGALLNTVACASEEAPDAHSPISDSSTIETPDTSPQNRVGRCVLEANRTVILGILDSPQTVFEPEKDGYFPTYLFKSEGDPSDISSVMIDDSIDGQTSYVYYIHADGENGSDFISTGKITLPVEAGLAKHSLKNLDPSALQAEDIAKTIDFKTSGIKKVTQLDLSEGTVVQKIFTSVQAEMNCDLAAEFTEHIDIKPN